MRAKMNAPCSGQASTARGFPFELATDTPNIAIPHAQHQTGAASRAVQDGPRVEVFSPPKKTAKADHETADGYSRVVAHLCDGWRVIVCKDDLQWIIQRRKKGGGEWPWRAVGYCRTRRALIRLTAASCGQIDPVAWEGLADLPEEFAGAA